MGERVTSVYLDYSKSGANKSGEDHSCLTSSCSSGKMAENKASCSHQYAQYLTRSQTARVVQDVVRQMFNQHTIIY